ncbi:hypothetical protein TNCV_4515951 [Trichonephila clavipes]|nr:hypothetical protein TNCV_4515951 [Trichonephila clavipes]
MHFPKNISKYGNNRCWSATTNNKFDSSTFNVRSSSRALTGTVAVGTRSPYNDNVRTKKSYDNISPSTPNCISKNSAKGWSSGCRAPFITTEQLLLSANDSVFRFLPDNDLPVRGWKSSQALIASTAPAIRDWDHSSH